LPTLNLDVKETSVSGISSGGFMTTQFLIAHSSIVKGAGVVAAGPFYCAQGNVLKATTRCSCTLDPESKVCNVTPSDADLPVLISTTQEMAQAGLIDSPSNITHQRVATFAGGQDPIVPPPVVKQLGEYLKAMGLPPENLSANVTSGAGHTMPTIAFGNACSLTQEPYIGRCGVDAAGKILNWIYGRLNPPAKGRLKGKYIEFDQKAYVPAGASARYLWETGLDNSGWLYVPEACMAGAKCRLHIALHGCKQGQSFLPLHPPPGGGLYYGTTFVKHAGYAPWADTNNIVVLFPQAVSIPFKNPYGCWDWWGYTDAHYADRQSVQIGTLRAMVERLASGAH
jgi:poly(3-hydroxybutyrate) depolymerase